MKAIKVLGIIQDAGRGGAYVLLPIDPEKAFGKKNRIPVVITFEDNITYRGSIVNMGEGPMIPVLKSIRAELQKDIGDEIRLEIALDMTERKIVLPPDLLIVFKHNDVLSIFEKLSYTHQKEHLRYITEAKKEETKQRRIEKTIQFLKGKN